MSFKNFCHLPDSEKIDLLYKDGVYIGKQKINDAILIIYQLQHFYVEIKFTKYRKEIASLIVTEDIEILTPYSDQIDVKELITTYE